LSIIFHKKWWERAKVIKSIRTVKSDRDAVDFIAFGYEKFGIPGLNDRSGESQTQVHQND
jgi:hypothetical protein